MKCPKCGSEIKVASEGEWYRRIGKAYLDGFQAGVEGHYLVINVPEPVKEGKA